MKTDTIKAGGIHYTPPALASFLASVTADFLPEGKRDLVILDPACGEGELLAAIAEALPVGLRRRAKLVGYEMDAGALEQADDRLKCVGVKEVVLDERDFLMSDGVESAAAEDQLQLFNGHAAAVIERFDVVIANPPYVRTQVLGSAKAQDLARRFGLKGRVDLYHAFTKGMAALLNPGGVLGLLTSNRFLTVRSGALLRHLLRTEFDLRAVYDLGDTRLFSAAVLPVIVIGRKSNGASRSRCIFDRVYEDRTPGSADSANGQFESVLDAVRRREVAGTIGTPTGKFRIECGFLTNSKQDEVWSLSTVEFDEWLDTVRAHQTHCFDDIAQIRVGIKTTADEVFIRDEWDSLPKSNRPESELIKPLITHRDACRWSNVALRHHKSVLYPYCGAARKRIPIALDKYPAHAVISRDSAND